MLTGSIHRPGVAVWHWEGMGWHFDSIESGVAFPRGPYASKAEAQDRAAEVYPGAVFFDGWPECYSIRGEIERALMGA